MEQKVKKVLQSSDLKNSVYTLINEIKKEKESHIEELILEIDRLKREIESEKDELKKELNRAFELMEKLADELESGKKEELISAIEENKLKTLEFLGILKETTEAAIIAAIEKNEDIEETIEEITKNLAFETIDFNVDAEHIKDVSKTILLVASDIASVSINYSDEILRGSVFGVKKGILKSIEKFKEIVENTPQEARSFIVSNYENIIRDLNRVDEIYVSCIKEVADRSETGVKEKLQELSNELGSVIYKLKNSAEEAVELFRAKLNNLSIDKEATTSLLKNSASEAKRLGIRAFMMAKAALDGAIKGAKDAINKEKNEK